MSTNTEKKIFDEISAYKWGRYYCCMRCGNDSFKKGKKPYSRRCTSCDYDESLIKHTAFEGLRFSIGIAYLILQELYDKFNITAESRIVPAANGKYISLLEYVRRSKGLEMSSDRIDEHLQAYIKKIQPSVRQLSRKYKVEENSITKLLDKVNARICIHDIDEMDNAYQRLEWFVKYNWNRHFFYLVSMLSIPLVGKWKYGETVIKGQHYTIVSDCRTDEWYILPVKYLEDNNGNYERIILSNEPKIIYGSLTWKKLFVGVK